MLFRHREVDAGRDFPRWTARQASFYATRVQDDARDDRRNGRPRLAFRQLNVLLFGSGFDVAWRDHVVMAASAMAFNMTVPMVLWRRHRGHSWERDCEMAMAMNVPVLPLLVPYWLGAIPSRGVLGL